MTRQGSCIGLILVILAGTGCSSGPKIVPVSGVVYLDGKPKAGLHVSFQPIGSDANPNPGRGSHAITDAEGRFTLTYDGAEPGAVVGKHRVAISTVLEGEGANFDPETGSPDGMPAAGGHEIIPSRFNDQTELTFDVPPEGTDQAKFDLKSK